MQDYSISYCEFYKLKAESSGGALYLNMRNMNLVKILFSYFCECTAPNQGGAVFSNVKNTTTKMCCFVCCATEHWTSGCWGFASNLESSVGSFTSHVVIFRCCPDKKIYKGHIAYSTNGGTNKFEHINITKCECNNDNEGFHIKNAKASSVRYLYGSNNTGWCTIYQSYSELCKIEKSILCYNVESYGSVFGDSQTTMTSCVFYKNTIDSGHSNLKLYNCTTSQSSFGKVAYTDYNCKKNVNREPDILQYMFTSECKGRVQLGCTSKSDPSIGLVALLLFTSNFCLKLF